LQIGITIEKTTKQTHGFYMSNFRAGPGRARRAAGFRRLPGEAAPRAPALSRRSE
jgi:hypothetical protein